MSSPTGSARTPLILIHGAWLSARGRENFAGHFGKRFDVPAPEWPRKEGDVREVRALGGRTDSLEFEGRPHLPMAAPDWDEVAAAIDSWLDGVLEVQSLPAQSASA